jgi:cytoskeletal protein CcmA (bactofilin family)
MKTKTKTNKLFLSVLVLGFIFTMSFPAMSQAAEFKAGQTYSLYKDEIISGNLYAAGSNVTIDGNVDGDLHAVGGNILINGRVRDDLFAAGGTINVISEVGQDLRLAGGNIVVNNKVNGDLVVAGGTIELTSNSFTRGDVMIAGGSVNINGPIEGNLTVKGGDVTINSEVKGRVSIAAGNKFNIGSRAIINNDLNYTSPLEAQIDSNAKISGKVSYTPLPVKNRDKGGKTAFSAILTFFWIAKLLALIICALIIFYFFRKETIQVADKAWENFARYFLRGFIMLFLTPIAIVIMLITLVGMPLALMALFSYLVFLLLAGILSGVLFGRVLYQLLERKLATSVTWENIVVGILILMLVGLIPFIGWVIVFIFFLVSLGSITDLVFSRLAPEKQ